MAEFDAMIAVSTAVAAKAIYWSARRRNPLFLISFSEAKAKGKNSPCGGQDCHPKSSGAHNRRSLGGNVADSAATPSWSSIPESPRRTTAKPMRWCAIRERQKADAAWRAGLVPPAPPKNSSSIGDTTEQRVQVKPWTSARYSLSARWRRWLDLGHLVVAYSRSGDRHRADPTTGNVEQVHRFIRRVLTRPI